MPAKTILKTCCILNIYLLGIIKPINAQVKIESKLLSLNNAIELAKENSYDYKIIESEYKSSFWDYQNFKSQFLPKLTLSGTIPDYFQSVTEITLPNGNGSFVSQNQASSNLNLNFSDELALTGGTISASSNLNRLDLFGKNSSTNYNSTPLSFSYNQGSFTHNPFKNQKKIEALSFEEATRNAVEGMEDISLTTIGNYFNALLAQVKVENAGQDYKNADSLYKFAKDEYNLGKIMESDFIQSRINLLKAKTAVLEDSTTFGVDCKELLSYLNLDGDIKVELEIPDSLEFFNISFEKAFEEAKSNRPEILEFKKTILQAEEQLETAKSHNSVSLSVNTNFGFSQVGDKLKQVYSNLNNNQSMSLTLSVPILDWGAAKASINGAKQNIDLEEAKITQENIEFKDKIYEQVSNWYLQQNEIEISKQSALLARKNFDIVKEEYFLGKVGFLELSQAQQTKNDEIVNYINALQDYWTSFYTIRKLTLFDFKNNRKIDLDISPGDGRF